MTFAPGTDLSEAFEAARRDALASLAAERMQVVDRIGAGVVAQLSLAPVWTSEVLDASGLAPGSVLEELVDAGVATQANDRFFVPFDRAREYVEPLLTSGGSRAVAEHLEAVADGVARARAADVAVPASLDRFAALSDGATTGTAVAEQLLRKVEGSEDVAEAVNWIDAAERLEVCFGRPVMGARLRAGRLVARRRRDDDIEGFLEGYFSRPEQEATLLATRNGAGPRALHLKGDGGTGKTMLVRWLEAGFPSDGSRGSVVRVDFDYLHPSYPGSEPGLLVLLLAAELRMFATEQAVTRFDRLDALVADWHERIEEAEHTRPAEVPAVRAERIDLVYGSFAEALRALPQPVVVILDTVEELEKAPGGTANVVATVDMVRRVLEDVPGARMVLSGRRDLPLPKDTGRLNVQGFTPDEARRFVTWVGLDPARTAAVVERVARKSADRPLSPFDLSMLARWAVDDPSFGVDEIRKSDDDRWVEHRILARLNSARLDAVLPVVVSLERFDVTTLGMVTGTDGAALDDLALAISRQEWVSVEAGGVYTVDANFGARLGSYYQKRSRAGWESDRRRAAAALRAHCEGERRTGVTVEHVAAAIRLSDPADVDLEAWWGRLEDKARAEGAFDWLLAITSRLRGSGGGVEREHQLYPSVTASHAACLAHEVPGSDPVELWQEVLDLVPPDSRLAARAGARFAAHVGPLLERWAGRLDEQLAASFVAGLERLLDTTDGLRPTVELLGEAVSDLSPELNAMARLLLGRAEAREGGDVRARLRLEEAVGLADASVGAQTGNEWLDWPVEDVAARLRLWAADTWWKRLGSPEEAKGWLERPRDLANVDRERMASLALVLSLATGRCDDDVGVGLESWLDSRLPVHARTPPLFVAQCSASARRGDVDGAVKALQEWTLRHFVGEPYVAGERALLRLVRQYRLRDVGIGLSTGLADSMAAEDVGALCDVDAFAFETSPRPWLAVVEPPGPEVVHAWWRVVKAGDQDSIEEARRWPWPSSVTESSPVAVLHCFLDRNELDALSPQKGRFRALGRVEQWVRAVRSVKGMTQWTFGDHEPEQVLRLMLRFLAFENGDVAALRSLEPLVDRVGRGLAAEMAVDEGDSLALRLPGRARTLLLAAASWFADVDDAAGEVRARTAALVAAQVAGAPGASDGEVLALEEAYTRLVRQGRTGPLPAWMALTSSPVAALEGSPTGWRPTVARLVAALARRAGDSGPELRAALMANFAKSGPSGRLELPAELALLCPPIGSTLVTGDSIVVNVGGTVSGQVAVGSNIGSIVIGRDPASAGRPPIVLTVGRESTRTTTRIARLATVRVEREDLGLVADVVPDPLLPLDARRAQEAGLGSLVDDRFAPVLVRHPPDLGAVPWEAVIEAAAPGSWSDRPVWRQVNGATRRPLQEHDGWPVSLTAGESEFYDVWPASQLSGWDESAARVVHAVGSVAETRSGVGFSSGSRQKGEAPFLESRELVGRWSSAELVVLQGLPDEEPDLADWSREQAAYLRQLGTDLAYHGVPAVLVMPGVARRSALVATEALVSGLDLPSHRLLRAGVLLAAVAEVREILRDTNDARGLEDAVGVSLILSDTVIE